MNSDALAKQFEMSGAREAVAGGWTHIQQQIVALEEAVAQNPGLAFDLARALVESACKTALAKRGWRMKRAGISPGSYERLWIDCLLYQRIWRTTNALRTASGR
jgi:hypothetical protein